MTSQADPRPTTASRRKATESVVSAGGLVAKLRPAKVRNALTRRWFEHKLHRHPLDPNTSVEHLGTSYGGWMVPTDAIQDGWVCYCIGTGTDISFELALLQRWDLTIRAFDAVEHYVSHVRTLTNDPRLSFHHAAVSTYDGPLNMKTTRNPDTESVSAEEYYDGSETYEAPGRTLQSLMAQFGDTQIDLLKLDVEGSEYRVLRHLDLASLGIKVFSVQLHHNGSVRDARRLIGDLARQGFRPVGMRSAVKMTFLRETQ